MQTTQAVRRESRKLTHQSEQPPLHVLEPTFSGHPAALDLELIVTELFKAVDSAIRDEFDVAQDCMERAASLLRVEPRPRTPAADSIQLGSTSEPQVATGLAPWQIRKITAYIAENLESSLAAEHLAAQVSLSRFHFSRAFKATFGDPPHRYLLRRRIERAQGLMLTTNLPLAQIALECGLVDQAHFGRSFRRIVGETPAAWRRARSCGSLPDIRRDIRAVASPP